MATTKYKKGADGYFSTRVWDGTYVNGKKHYKHLRSKKSSRDLESKVKILESEVQQRKYVKQSKTTFLEYARMWKSVYKQQCQNGTKAMYENIIEKHFVALECVPLQEIERIHLQLLLNNAQGKKRTQQQIVLTFKQVLKSAVTDRLFPANVMDDIFRSIEPIKYTAAEKRPLASHEKDAIFKANLSDSDRAFVYLLYGCGIRREEALALTIFDINLKERELTINKAHEFIKGQPSQKDPKTKNSFRTIPIPDKIFTFISQYVQHLKSIDQSYLFTMRNGKPVTKSSYDKMWRRIIKELQAVSREPITGLTAHIFRHNYCTNLCYQIPAISIKKIAQLIGDKEATVLKVYNHIMLEKENAISAVNNAMD